MAEPQLKFGVFYDFRNPRQFREGWTERYRQAFEQMDWVDRESRFDEDGDTPSVLPLATAIAARTERVGIATNIVQMPLHHPLKVAEDALTIDALSGGRFRHGLGIRRSAEAGVQEVQLFAQAPGAPIATGFERLRYVSDPVTPAFQGSSERRA